MFILHALLFCLVTVLSFSLPLGVGDRLRIGMIVIPPLFFLYFFLIQISSSTRMRDIICFIHQMRSSQLSKRFPYNVVPVARPKWMICLRKYLLHSGFRIYEIE